MAILQRGATMRCQGHWWAFIRSFNVIKPAYNHQLLVLGGCGHNFRQSIDANQRLEI